MRLPKLLLTGFFMVLVAISPLPVQATARQEAGMATSGSLVGMDRTELRQRLEDIKRLGVVWIRVDFSWPAIQPVHPDNYEWGAYDYLVDQSAALDLKILAVVAYTPAWAQDPACAAVTAGRAAQKCNPKTPELYAEFAGRIAQRYQGKNIRGWELWNEPNLRHYWRTMRDDGFGPNPEVYATYANAAAEHIRKFNHDSVVLPGGLAPLFEPSPQRGMSQSEYLTRLLPHLRRELFHGVAIHPYSWPVLPGEQEIYNAFYTVDNGPAEHNLRHIMDIAGWNNKEIWATEYGASTRGSRLFDGLNHARRPDHVTEERQATIIAEGMRLWYRKQNVGPLFVHSDSDKWLMPYQNQRGFGLRRADGSEKPSYGAFQRGIDQMGW